MWKKRALKAQLALMRKLLCLPIALAFVFAGFSGLQEFKYSNPQAPVSKVLRYMDTYLMYGATNCALSAGSSVATINTALTAAGGGTCTGTVNANTVALAAGAYSANGTITIPCNATLTGPVLAYHQTHYQTAIFTDSVNQPFRTTAGCSSYGHLSYIEGNGNQQSNAGGNVYIIAGTTNFIVDHNWFHGATGGSYPGCCSEVQVYMGDSFSSALTQNIQITMNEFGPEVVNQDCGSAMTASSTSSGGGFCNGVGSQGQLKNISVDHNIFHNLEQGAKVAEACTGNNNCQPGNSSYPPNNGNTQNYTMSYNWFYNIQRIDFETQSNYYDTSHPTTQFVNYNSMGDRNNGGGFQLNFDLSIANGCGNPPATANCTANVDYNVDVQVSSNANGAGNEFWGDSNSHQNYGLYEGKVASRSSPAEAWGGAIDYAQSGAFNFNNNTFNLTYGGSNTNCSKATANGGFWNNEDAPASNPSCSGNTFSTAGTGTYTSAAPTISPNGGTFSGNQTVTLVNSGANRDQNTSIWYTTDGSTPVVGSSNLYTGPFTITSTQKITAIGMWGAINQPYSYPSGYGYVPSAPVSAQFTGGVNYYISPSGSDSNNGTSTSTAWLTPNHALTCGTTLNAVPGTYSAGNFGNGHWGTVSCPSGNNVVWLTCQTFDGCKISSTTSDGMWIDKSYWGVQGWEVTTSTYIYGACFHIGATSGVIHHIIMANNIANSCQGGGFTAYNNSTTASVDYIVYIGNIAYNAARGSGACYSGLNIYEPIASDTAAGTHMFVAGNFSYDNVDGNPCNGGTPTDGEGVNFDTFDGDQGGTPAYTQQAVAENNISIFNGGRGVYMENNNVGSSHAPTYFKYNTMYGNNKQATQQFCNGNGDLTDYNALDVTAEFNLVQTDAATMCTSPSAKYALAVSTADASVVFDYNYANGVSGNNTFIYNSGSFAYGSHNVIGTNPTYTSATDPGAPSCGAFSSVPACMATVVANFVPTVSAAKSYGYQPPQTTNVADPLYPQWLCNVNFPSGLVTPGCGTSPTLVSGVQGNLSSVNTLAVGAPPVQQMAKATYSDGSTQTLPDPYGNTAIWTSANPSILNVSSTGLVSCLAPTTGTVVYSQVTSAPGGVPFSPWGWTCTSATAVATPAFSPGTQTFNGSISVSISDTTAGASIYYTLDGSTPTTSSTLYTGPITITTTTTVKAIAAASGLTNSSIATATYTAKTFTKIAISTTGNITSLAAGATNQIVPLCTYSDGSTDNCTLETVTYTSSAATTVATINTTGLVTANGPGTTNIQATAVGIQSNTLPLTITSTAPSLTSCYQGNPAGANTLIVGGPTVTQHLFCFYGGVTPNITNDCSLGDVYGNGPISWSSDTPANGTTTLISGTYPNYGLVSPVAAGTFNTLAKATGNLTCNNWTWTVSNPVIVSIAVTTTGGITSIYPPNTVQLIATATYNNGTTANVTSSVTTWAANNSNATINSAGLVTAVTAGNVNLSATIGTVTGTLTGFTIATAPPPVIVNSIQMTHVKASGKVKTQ
jgi:hypothetical protein